LDESGRFAGIKADEIDEQSIEMILTTRSSVIKKSGIF
jgi:hypothetical protein